jgi:hypothetical protein
MSEIANFLSWQMLSKTHTVDIEGLNKNQGQASYRSRLS